MTGFRIRRASLKDIPILVQHRRMMFEEMTNPTEEELMILDESYSKWANEMMRKRLFHGYVVATVRGRAVASGCVWLREVQPSPGHPPGFVPYLLSVFTRPEARRNGLASMIVDEAVKWGRKNGYHQMVLHASVDGRKVYSKLGWERGWEMEFNLERPENQRQSASPSKSGRASKRPRPGRRSP